MYWTNYLEQLSHILASLEVSNAQGQEIELDQAFGQLWEWTHQIRKDEQAIFLVGNGASASIASHVAADMAKNAQVRTEVFTDLALITALANDLSYDQVFALPLKRKMKAKDILVAISSSGNSPNIIKAARTAQELGGQVITFSAMAPDNLLRSLGDMNFYLPAASYGLAEIGHTAILHYWIDLMVEHKTNSQPKLRTLKIHAN